jgi:UDP-N-acetylmuramyl pentapeptide phosphotransferase/UDP-N-acetylglucosamine-1-phosphate transferase
MALTYGIIAVLLLAAELIYFRIADKCNIIEKPNERSSHTKIVLRGGGIIFAISILVWMIWQMVNGEWCTVQDYLPFLIGLMLIAVLNVKSGKSYILLKSENARKHGHFRGIGGK